MRVLFDGDKSDVRLPNDYDLTEKEVESWNPIIQRLEIKDSDVNDYLNGIIARRKLIDLENLSNETNLTITEIVDKLMGYHEAVKEITAYDYAKKYLREEVENSFLGIGTKKNYRNAYEFVPRQSNFTLYNLIIFFVESFNWECCFFILFFQYLIFF